ncbi:MAG: hypothetical protein D6800_02255, partial [Candidatus Zixiibacteriota bacterium]
STFALPYMRIGMALAFENHQQEGAHYFALARQFVDKLPVRERSILDVYSDLWQTRKYDEAFAKMKLLAENYPDDKEVRALNGLLVSFFARDTTAGFNELHAALRIDPTYPLALQIMSSLFENRGDIDSAIAYAERIRENHPESIEGYSLLPRLYRKAGRLDDAVAVAKQFRKQFPDKPAPYTLLAELSIRQRKFGQAEKYLNMLADRQGKDPFVMLQVVSLKASLAVWRGQFREALRQLHRGVQFAEQADDSARLFSAYTSLGMMFYQLHRTDSSLYYMRMADRWANTFGKVAYPLHMIVVDPANDSVARPMMRDGLEQFKAKLPSGLWPMADALQQMYDGYAHGDSDEIITGYRQLLAAEPNKNSGNIWQAAFIMIARGDYQEGLDLLTPQLHGLEETTSGAYPLLLYYAGRAHEGLGQTDKAIAAYREMLHYWSHPDLELPEITDARARLANLTG